MWKHQTETVANTKGSKHLALIWEMRLGKSRVAVLWANQYIGPKLIVCPLSCIPDWLSELQGLGIQAIICKGGSPAPLFGWCITNHASVIQTGHKRKNGKPKPTPAPLTRYPWKVMIWDESYYLHNPQAQVTRVAVDHTRHIPHKAILTGLPNPECITDIFEQVCFLYGSFMGYTNYWQWRDRYFHQPDYSYKWMPNRGTKVAVQTELAKVCSVLSLKDVGMQGATIFCSRFVQVPKHIRKVYNSCQRTFELGDRETEYIPVVVSWMVELVGGCCREGEQYQYSDKLDLLLRILTNEIPDEQVVVWFRHNWEIDFVGKALTQVGKSLEWESMRGSNTLQERAGILKRFRTGQIRYLLIQQRLGHYGLNLSKASVAIYYSKWHSYNLYRQSLMRIQLAGKKEPVLYISLIAEDSIDSDIHTGLSEKGVRSADLLRGIHNRVKENRSAYQRGS